ncbi:schlafen family member 5-like [Saccoglossus kowalevskii]|uniref:Schlafen family member 5-like n=1 Tax=Saccoglossus kowalevskii TaxID=10224 RepID=A0ABM0MJ54_SACKO|nr:PREDICTED: schlafen family member 5-like [Saccoglossus kowalevskii]
MDLSKLGETILHCDVNINKRVNVGWNSNVQVYLCALLNSGGGILHLQNTSHENDDVNFKSLDTWWSGVEQQLRWVLSEDDICNFIDLVGSFNDPDLYVFVKGADHICTVHYHARVPTDTATLFLSYHTVMKLMMQQDGQVGCLSKLRPFPNEFQYGKQIAGIPQETMQIQFKFLSSDKDVRTEPIADRISWFIRRYVSAFANHAGGHIIFGVEDKTCQVYGEEIPDEATKYDIIDKVEERMKKTIWVHLKQRVQRGIHWDIGFYPVLNTPEGITGSRVVVVVSVVKYPGLVYTQCPESYHIVNGKVEQLSFTDWRSNLMMQITDIDELKYKYHRLEIQSPRSVPVYMLHDTITVIQEKHFKLKEDTISCFPTGFLQRLSSKPAREWLQKFISQCTMSGIMILLSWTLFDASMVTKPKDAVCDVLLLTKTGIILITLVEGAVTSKTEHYSVQLGAKLKQRIVLDGGCREKFNIICLAFSCLEKVPGNYILENHCLEQYHITEDKIQALLHSIVVVMATFTPMINESWHKEKSFLLTFSPQQFELLWLYRQHKELWVYGPPGSGKTLSAICFIKGLLKTGCHGDEVLYLCENQPLCDNIRKLNICQAVCRRKFLADYNSSSEKGSCYENIKHIVIDEAQNFKDWDGDWYRLANHIVRRGEDGAGHHGYLWVFVDTNLQVHKFNTGMPDLTHKITFGLTQIIRCSGELFGFASKFLQSHYDEVDSLDTSLAHDYPGEKVKFLSSHNADIDTLLPNLVREYTQRGYHASDVAILFSKKQEAEERSDLPVGEATTVDSVKHFSGLSKPVVIAVHPKINPQTGDYNKFMLNLISRASSQLIIISASDNDKSQLMDKYND